MQPMDSQVVSRSPRINQPKINANTDSRLIIIEAVEGSRFFWPTICREYAAPIDKKPVWAKGSQACPIPDSVGVSVKNMTTADRVAQINT